MNKSYGISELEFDCLINPLKKIVDVSVSFLVMPLKFMES
jgi:hypothetical protein